MQPGLFSHKGDVKVTVMRQHEYIVQPSLDAEFGDKNLFLKLCSIKSQISVPLNKTTQPNPPVYFLFEFSL